MGPHGGDAGVSAESPPGPLQPTSAASIAIKARLTTANRTGGG